ncbi:hypothetical protein BDN72DRAFT_829994 [Pluteus cervinus]|uniref:Uncharacterized protein n=1 Tax=Pluteus cervinus TaxID=181527 RepID=A0ACD3BFD3_9AGAR|nr:hypothetical protein BDN72DRAFT_829994 [Pluteus cervinus]
MDFAPKPGCPMCGIVASSLSSPANSPSSPSFPTSLQAAAAQPEILWRDTNFTIYKEKVNPVSSKGHIVIVFNLHVPSIYTLSSSDLPLLIHLRDTASRLLASVLHPPSSPYSRSISPSPASPSRTLDQENDFRIGFITPPFKDTKIPVTDHLHAHAFFGPGDLLGWWRGIAYSPVAWYSIDDLIAEIRESTSNNRIKSGHPHRQNAPINKVPLAGARMGTADGTDTSLPSVGLVETDIETGRRSTSSSQSLDTPRRIASPSQMSM